MAVRGTTAAVGAVVISLAVSACAAGGGTGRPDQLQVDRSQGSHPWVNVPGYRAPAPHPLVPAGPGAATRSTVPPLTPRPGIVAPSARPVVRSSPAPAAPVSASDPCLAGSRACAPP